MRKAFHTTLAILDFKLPKVRGGHPEVDESVCQELREDHVPVIHFTGYPNDPSIERHMMRAHSEHSDSPQVIRWGPVALIDKSDVSYLSRILKMLAPYYQEQVSNAVTRELASVFGDPDRQEGARLGSLPASPADVWEPVRHARDDPAAEADCVLLAVFWTSLRKKGSASSSTRRIERALSSGGCGPKPRRKDHDCHPGRHPHASLPASDRAVCDPLCPPQSSDWSGETTPTA